MKARQKLLLDRVVGWPLAALANAVVWPVGKLLRRPHGDGPAEVAQIVVAKLVGLGSILRATPLFAGLRRRYPQARLTLLTTRANAELGERLPWFDECLYIDDGGCWSLARTVAAVLPRLWRRRVDLYFDLEVYSAFSTLLATASLARNRYGFYSGTTWFRQALHTHLVYFNVDRHVAEIYLKLGEACGLEASAGEAAMLSPTVREADAEELDGWLARHGQAAVERLVVVNPNASDLSFERRWPRDYFAGLIERLVADGWQVALVGSQGERDYVEELLRRVGKSARPQVFDTAGQLGLGAVAALFQRARLVITNDSGLFHLAASLRVPSLSLWGPAAARHFIAATDNTLALEAEGIYCRPCVHRTDFPPCRGDNICMKAISPACVYVAACQRLGGSPSAAAQAELEALFARTYDHRLDITVRRQGAR